MHLHLTSPLTGEALRLEVAEPPTCPSCDGPTDPVVASMRECEWPCTGPMRAAAPPHALTVTCADGELRLDYREVFRAVRAKSEALRECPSLIVSDALVYAWRKACEATTEGVRAKAAKLTVVVVQGEIVSLTCRFALEYALAAGRAQ